MSGASSGAYAPKNEKKDSKSAKTDSSAPSGVSGTSGSSSSGASLLRKRGVALLITIIVLIASTLMSVNRSLGAECRNIEDGFYNGVYVNADGYVHKSIYSQLRQRCDAANGLISLADGYDELSDEVDALRDAREILLRGLNDDSIFGMRSANDALTPAFNTLKSALAEYGLGENIRSAFDDYVSTFEGAQNVIDNSGYNESVLEFNRKTLNVFPANILGELAGVESPEFFE